MIQITAERYLELLVAEETLSRLEIGGVDNWVWYYESLNPPDEQSLKEFEESTKQEIAEME